MISYSVDQILFLYLFQSKEEEISFTTILGVHQYYHPLSYPLRSQPPLAKLWGMDTPYLKESTPGPPNKAKGV